MISNLRFGASALSCAAILTLAAASAYANHGPGASGGGSSTVSGETLKQNKWEVGLREDFTDFEKISPAEASQRALSGGDFDAVHRGYATSMDLSYGVTDDLQVGLTLGYWVGQNFVSAEQTGPATTDVGEGDITGLTDTTLLLKYRLYKGYWGNFAVLGGFKMPTGRTDVTLNNGEQPHPSDQPGSGSWDFPLGLAYSRFLTSHISLDASAMYMIRTKRDDFRQGDRLDAGIAFSYRFNDDIKQFPQYSVFFETLITYMRKDGEAGLLDENSGGVTIYATPGFRVRFDEHTSMTIAPSIPVYQNHYGEQSDIDYKVSIGFTYSN